MGNFLSRPYTKPQIIYGNSDYSPHPFMKVTSTKSSVALCFIVNRFQNLRPLQTELIGTLSSLQLISDEDINNMRKIGYQQACPFECNSIFSVVSLTLNIPKGMKKDQLIKRINHEMAPSKILGSIIFFEKIMFSSKKYVDLLSFHYLLPLSLLKENINSPSEISDFEFSDISSLFEGTFLFQNFNQIPNSPTSIKNTNIKTIQTFDVIKTIFLQNKLYCCLLIEGKSFFKGQIEKIVNLFVHVVKNKINKEEVKKYLDYEMYKINPAPEMPLILTFVKFDNFKKSLNTNQNEDDLAFNDCRNVKVENLNKLQLEISKFYENGALDSWIQNDFSEK
ncbi:hypothetical protein TRFO_37327 [Tritrichomonas foetus]|uniref:tRNA pseudouridine synthase n=1 Tax=Tritrichomonas foetus TaxID=1144522 RepID=A0A1J4JCS2_9EUKA|nr:hypothetical protein TRFO_37327 [Tritrichomonas foetus]|eukprot:OHS96473.1 hypothetical protein TRFO_37327 [Tritrichomonas foetus]